MEWLIRVGAVLAAIFGTIAAVALVMWIFSLGPFKGGPASADGSPPPGYEQQRDRRATARRPNPRDEAVRGDFLRDCTAHGGDVYDTPGGGQHCHKDAEWHVDAPQASN